MKSQREVAIDAYIEQHPSALQKAPTHALYDGKTHELTVYRLPAKLLIFNIGNGRFAAELMAEQKRLKKKLDATNPEHAKIIQKLLLEQSPEETTALKEDIEKNGQLDPGIITFDGAVINANRRMAILQLLHKETEKDKFEYLNVGRLPRGVGEKDLWKIEAKLQFGKDFRLEYGPINELLKIRLGKQSGLTERQISEALVGRYSESEVRTKIEILKLIDSYLSIIEKPGEYKEVLGSVQSFISLQSNVVALLKKGLHKSEVPKITSIGFAMIKGGELSHWDIRELRKITELPEARKTLYGMLDRKGNPVDDISKIKDCFGAAAFIVNAEKERNKPDLLATKALSALKQIDVKHPAVQKKGFQNLLSEIRIELVRLTGRGKARGK
jgi:hypothetical protein